jgi:hypothetical protein
MLLSQLTFPVTFVAPDGWVNYSTSKDNVSQWSLNAIRKYNRIHFIVADSEGTVWKLKDIEPIAKITFLGWLRSFFYPITVVIHLEREEGDPLEIFKTHFIAALKKDDDVLTQHHSRDKIICILNKAKSLKELTEQLYKMNITG